MLLFFLSFWRSTLSRMHESVQPLNPPKAQPLGENFGCGWRSRSRIYNIGWKMYCGWENLEECITGNRQQARRRKHQSEQSTRPIAESLNRSALTKVSAVLLVIVIGGRTLILDWEPLSRAFPPCYGYRCFTQHLRQIHLMLLLLSSLLLSISFRFSIRFVPLTSIISVAMKVPFVIETHSSYPLDWYRRSIVVS